MTFVRVRVNTIDPVTPARYTAGMRLGLPFVLAATLLAGCEKAGPKSSGKLSDDEASLMSRLPNKFGVAFGGNLPRLQKHLASSPLMKFARANEAVEGSAAWQDCLADKHFKNMLGVVDVRSGFELRFLMTGLDMDDLEGCAKQAKLGHKVDSDRKFITIDITTEGISTKLPYLVLEDGAIYARYAIGLGASLTPKFEEPSRAKMEADIDEVKQDNAAHNDKLIASMEKADRTKGMWFAGSAEGTLIGDQVHELYGSLDLEGGLEIDASVEMANSATSKKVMDAVSQARDAGGIMGSDVKKVIDALDVKRDGDRIRFTLKVSNAQLEKVFEKLAPMMPSTRLRGRTMQGRQVESLDD